jgi:hypothetical protein
MAAASANERFELPCDGNSSTCLDSLLDVMPELEYIEVPNDGDCFFHSIAAYYKRTGGVIIDRDTDLPLDIDPTNPRELRRYIVKEFIKLVVAKEPPYPDLISTILIENRTNKSLSQLYEPGAWAMNAFDIMINAVPTILMINLNIYAVNSSEQHQEYVITKAVYQPKQPELLNGRGLPTINLFLSGNHYGLLYPVGGENVRSRVQILSNKKELSNFKAKKAKEYEAQVKEAQKYEAQKYKGYHSKSNNLATLKKEYAALNNQSNQNNNNNSNSNQTNKLYNINSQIAILKKKIHNSNLQNMNAAIAESLRSVSLKNRQNNKTRASRNNSKKFVQQNAMNSASHRKASHNISVKRKPHVVSKNKDECNDMLKDELIATLISMGIENISRKMSKKELCSVYMSVIMSLND